MGQPSSSTRLNDHGHAKEHQFVHDVYAQYAAVGDGATDDSAAIQSAITAAGSAGTVYFQPYPYKLNNGLTLDGTKRVNLVFAEGATLVPAAGVTAITITATSLPSYGGSISGAHIDGSAINGQTGILIQDSTFVRLEAVKLDHLATGVHLLSSNASGIPLWCEHNTLQGVEFRNCTTGLLFEKSGGTGSFRGTTLIDTTFDHCDTSISLPSDCSIYSSYIQAHMWVRNGQVGMDMNGTLKGSVWVVTAEVQQATPTASIQIGVAAQNVDKVFCTIDPTGTWASGDGIVNNNAVVFTYHKGNSVYQDKNEAGLSTDGRLGVLKRQGDSRARIEALSAVNFLGPGFFFGLGSGVDTNVYRSAADTLKTDDQFVAADGVTTKTKAGAISDLDFTATPADGTIAVDITNSRIYVRVGGAWKSVVVA